MMATVAEQLGKAHHHHVNQCRTCGAWWFEDIVRGAFGQPAGSFRDTVMCDCPDTPTGFQYATMIIPGAERYCRCDKAHVEQFTPVHIRAKDIT